MRRLALLLALVLVAPALAQPAAPPADLAERLDGALSHVHDIGLFNGTVLVAQGDDVLYAEGFGHADMTWDVPNAPDTRFWLASVTKQFTAALTLLLVEEGAFGLDDPITAILPDYPAAQGDIVTVRMLLNHTSGIPSMTGMEDFMQTRSNDAFTVDEMLAVFNEEAFDFEPGSQYAYNNSGYFLLGALIEAATGMTYAEALQAKLFDPLGLDDTGYADGTVAERMATGYTRSGMGYAHARYVHPSVPYAAGMLYSTAPDLHRWNRALYGGEVFADDATLTAMTTPEGAAADAQYAFGIGSGTQEIGGQERQVYQHSGGIFGFSTQLAYVPGDELTVVVLDNAEGSSGQVLMALARTFYGEEVDLPKQPIAQVLMATIEGAATMEAGVEAALAQYDALLADDPDGYDFDEGQLNMLGYLVMGEGRPDLAIPIFQRNVEQFPEASNPYDSLGEAYMEVGQNDLAIENYQTSIELNPGNQNGRDMLERLGVTPEDATVEVSEEVLQGYVGTYRLAPGFDLAVTREGTQLFAQATGQPRFEVYPSSETEFYLTVVEAQLTFEVEDGAATGVVLHQGGRSMPAPRVEE
ncbi:MAG: serine hydrolase [Bacteroidota bacterium]